MQISGQARLWLSGAACVFFELAFSLSYPIALLEDNPPGDDWTLDLSNANVARFSLQYI